MASDVVGLIPAAGRASRLGPIPCSKEIFPVGYREDGRGGMRPVASCESLIEKFRIAGARSTFIVLRNGKWDIPAYLEDGQPLGMHLAYLIMRYPYGQPYTVDAAHPFVQDATVLFGFPDILLPHDDACIQLLDRKEASGADVVLGLFPARRPEKMDMVETDDRGRLTGFVIKPRETDLTHTWLLAAWSPAFTTFLHEHIARRLRNGDLEHPSGRELYVGDVFDAALHEGMLIETVPFPDTDYVDIGTPGDLISAVKRGVHAAGGPDQGRERTSF
jgi:glucose-1-phosphate thymidylyltransferase